MDLRLHKPVYTHDRRHIGHVNGFVVDYTTYRVDSFIVRKGIALEHDRVFSRDLVDQIDDNGRVTLTIDFGDVRTVPEFVEHQYVLAKPHQVSNMPVEWVGSGTGAPPVYFGESSNELGYSGQDPFGGAAPVAAPETTLASTISSRDTVITAGTDVISSDDKKIGDVGDVNYGPDGRLVEIVIRAGFLLHHDLAVPVSSIASVGRRHVRLKVSADEVRHPSASA